MPDGLRLITRGDDAGASRSANLAIREAWADGCVRNVSVLACSPFVAHAAELFRDCPGLCVGLHACITCEWLTPRWGPVLPAATVPSLVDKHGHFPPQVAPGVVAEQLAAELVAQLARLRGLGLDVRYVDEHMCFRWQVPEARAVIAELCQREGLIDADTLGTGLHRGAATLPEAVRTAADGTWVVVGHPCYDDAEMRGIRLVGRPEVDIGQQRDGERRMFLAPELRTALAERGARAISYSEAAAGTR